MNNENFVKDIELEVAVILDDSTTENNVIIESYKQSDFSRERIDQMLDFAIGSTFFVMILFVITIILCIICRKKNKNVKNNNKCFSFAIISLILVGLTWTIAIPWAGTLDHLGRMSIRDAIIGILLCIIPIIIQIVIITKLIINIKNNKKEKEENPDVKNRK